MGLHAAICRMLVAFCGPTCDLSLIFEGLCFFFHFYIVTPVRFQRERR